MNQSKFGDQKAEVSTSPLQPKQLLYRREAYGSQTGALIRSKKTADLLQLHSRESASNLQDTVPALHSQPVQSGGFIRSRRTAELLGIVLSGQVESRS